MGDWTFCNTTLYLCELSDLKEWNVFRVNKILGFSTTYWKKFFFKLYDALIISRYIASNGTVTSECKRVSEEGIVSSKHRFGRPICFEGITQDMRRICQCKLCRPRFERVPVHYRTQLLECYRFIGLLRQVFSTIWNCLFRVFPISSFSSINQLNANTTYTISGCW